MNVLQEERKLHIVLSSTEYFLRYYRCGLHVLTFLSIVSTRVQHGCFTINAEIHNVTRVLPSSMESVVDALTVDQPSVVYFA